jgi:hypothetical protein
LAEEQALMLTIIIAVASSAALCLCISVCIYMRRNKKTVEALQDVLVAVMTTKKAERWSEVRLPGGPKVTFAPNAKLTSSLSNKAVIKAIKTAEVKIAEAGESDVESPDPDPSSAASSPGIDAPGRFSARTFTSRRGVVGPLRSGAGAAGPHAQHRAEPRQAQRRGAAGV